MNLGPWVNHGASSLSIPISKIQSDLILSLTINSSIEHLAKYCMCAISFNPQTHTNRGDTLICFILLMRKLGLKVFGNLSKGVELTATIWIELAIIRTLAFIPCLSIFIENSIFNNILFSDSTLIPPRELSALFAPVRPIIAHHTVHPLVLAQHDVMPLLSTEQGKVRGLMRWWLVSVWSLFNKSLILWASFKWVKNYF